ncbi:hypothetical protein M422DRAFT_194237 [Sphaerobolus stellatus SS14]|uniref:DDE-1 domain-containing protein n=1 Tax=Sphaerobolus stellatus (strain SS14) TaxID=990650 RepID=A0A0C9UI08_SPHS4|nr:hypothetical protein M422DRAFT_194237 [Sphaerobolus stellatus SS14]
MVKSFDIQTRGKVAGKPHVLLVDGHNSHHTGTLLQYAKENNIIMLGYPPHCTHALQGLDVACLSHLKDLYWKELESFEELNHGRISKHDFPFVFGMAFHKAFTEDTILAAFQATGIHPFNPDIISPRQMKPSIPYSAKAPFPLPHATPAHRVMAATHYSNTQASNLTITTDSEHYTTPQRPSQQRYLDPSLYTPSKRVQVLVGSLAESKSVSHLVAEGSINANQRLPGLVLESIPEMEEPEWGLAEVLDDGVTAAQWKLRAQRLQKNFALA